MSNATVKTGGATVGTKKLVTINKGFGSAGWMEIRVSAVKTYTGYTLSYDTGDFRIVRRDVVSGRVEYRVLEREGGPARFIGSDLGMYAILEMALSAF